MVKLEARQVEVNFALPMDAGLIGQATMMDCLVEVLVMQSEPLHVARRQIQ